MRSSAITQIGLVGISIVIIFTYIRPTFLNIQEVQVEIEQYKDATAKAQEYNNKLQELLIRQRNITKADDLALSRFLPETMDSLAIMADIRSLVVDNGGQINDVEAGEVLLPNTDVEFEDYFEEQSVTANRFVTQSFKVSFSSDYDTFKQILREMEMAEYVMEVKSLSFGSKEEASFDELLDVDEIQFEMVVGTYSLNTLNSNN